MNGSSYGTASNLLQYVTSLSQQPAAWFNLSATFVGIDPPGQSAADVLEHKKTHKGPFWHDCIYAVIPLAHLHDEEVSYKRNDQVI